MRKEKEVKEKILELKTEFLEGEGDNIYSLRNLKRSLKILNWVLGKDWITDRIPAKHGGEIKK